MGMVTMNAGCTKETVHFAHSKSVKAGHMVYFENGGYMTIIAMEKDGIKITEKGRANIIRNVKDRIKRDL